MTQEARFFYLNFNEAMIMALIEEWRWEFPNENPLGPLWGFMRDYVKTEFERMEKEKEEKEKEELIREIIERLEVIDDE